MKATITRPDGIRIEVEGTAEEIAMLIPAPRHLTADPLAPDHLPPIHIWPMPSCYCPSKISTGTSMDFVFCPVHDSRNITCTA